MLKWKRVSITAGDGVEETEVILIGMAGKNRVIKHVALSVHDAVSRLVVYRDAEQFVDVPMNVLTDESPFLPMDLPLIEGQFCNIGFYNGTGGEDTVVITIGYTETG
ncbi:unnamed protein product [marine sediment metagenome]|uniref:Uncharacterized protein n=1 Tax=marine sediment metagenome TaxID=412755 RepID=X0ZUS6_9ZZZZ